jgi:putative oxidoreductase
MFTRWKALSSEPIDKDVALLVIRLGIGFSMAAFHGYGKISGGPEMWERVGGAMAVLGIGFAPVLWGFLAAVAEFVCSILLILGALFRPAAAMLAFTMFVAVMRHLSLPPESPNSGWNGASHALELLCVYVGLLLAGPGRYAFSLIRRPPEPAAGGR